MSAQKPQVGVGVIITKDDAVLLGQRMNAHAAGQWALPGGHLEFGETVAVCAQREVMEEAGIVITDLTEGPWSEEFFDQEQKHYITVTMHARWRSGEPAVLEPGKCARWRWVPRAELKDYDMAIFSRHSLEKAALLI